MSHPVSMPKITKNIEHPGSGKYSDPKMVLKLHDRSLIVCQIVLADNGKGTGFLIGKDMIMTNNHVVDSLEVARSAKALFFHTTHSEPVEVDLNPDDCFYTSSTPDALGIKPLTITHLDFTIVSIKSHPKIAEISHLAFSIFQPRALKKESHANVIHHPVGSDGSTYQKLSFRENLIKQIISNTLHYTTATLPGSSGAPVMDDEGNLIALHRGTCTKILKTLLKETMLNALLKELFPGVVFTNETLTLGQQDFMGRRAALGGSALYVFSEGILKGKYYHQGKTASLFGLIATKHTPAKEWALHFLNKRLPLDARISDCHKACNTAITIKAINKHLENAGFLEKVRERYDKRQDISIRLVNRVIPITTKSISTLIGAVKVITSAPSAQLCVSILFCQLVASRVFDSHVEKCTSPTLCSIPVVSLLVNCGESTACQATTLFYCAFHIATLILVVVFAYIQLPDRRAS